MLVNKTLINLFSAQTRRLIVNEINGRFTKVYVSSRFHLTKYSPINVL